MAQKPRIKAPGHAAAYHVITRTNGAEYRLDDYMKQYFIKTLKKLKNLYYVSYCSYTILENHYTFIIGVFLHLIL